ncbi:(2Fe-2S) ferredoxin domain-containing protein [Paenibacillus sp. HN-1]|uniref:(2Fe-2S) ferredoxin domain-containing protein n=1 Tax=Paenibacillus TaxID=44249 RepID=UPI001CA7FD8B|nr:MULTISPECIES: (2Fe-2S) ferredoxin domain-containing protein [Paenibacillus]MBY9081567.1 (2Fe-2S) ferredoxin domain-containing protein [Paenibacillus sp. CGMCC 1.18879]MBY9087690.1 (2Fe-2S) ferredoxin domain-containing protein [Paenibacillus sinensis]
MTTWNLEGTTCHLLVCGGSSCRKRKGEDIIDAIDGEIEKQGAEAVVHTTLTRCNGRCNDAPVVISYPDGVWYGDMSPKHGKALVRQLLQGERLEEKIVYTFGAEGMQAAGTSGTKGKRKGKGRSTSKEA